MNNPISSCLFSFKPLFFWIFALFVPPIVFGQTSDDHLFNESDCFSKYSNIPTISDRLDSIAQCAWSLSSTNLSASITVLDAATDIAIENNELIWAARTQFIISDVLSKEGKFNKALLHGQSAYDLTKQADFKPGIVPSLLRLSICYQDINHYGKSNECLMKGLEFSLENNDSANLSKIYNNLGEQSRRLKRYPEALDYFNRSIEINRRSGDSLSLAVDYCNLAATYLDQEKWTDVLQFQYPALKYLIRCQHVTGMATIYNNLGVAHLNQGTIDSAMFCYQKARELAIESNIPTVFCASSNNIGEIFLQKKDYKSAYKYSIEAYNKAKEYKIYVRILESIHNLEQIANAENDLKKAYTLAKEYQVYSDSMDYASLREQIGKTEYEHSIYLKTMEVERLKAEKNLQTSLNQTQRNRNLLILAALILVSGLAFVLYIVNGKNHKTNKSLQLSQNELVLKNSELEILNWKLNLLLEHLGDGVLLIDNHRDIKYINQSFIRLLGSEEDHESFVGKNIAEFKKLIAIVLQNQEQICAKVDELIISEENFNEIEFLLNTGATLQLELIPVFFHSKRNGLLMKLRDISGIRRYEKSLKEINASKDQILAMVAHDLRAPIGNAKSLVDLVLSFDNNTVDSIPILKMVESSCTNAMEIMDELLDAATLENGTALYKEISSLSDLVTRCVDGVARSAEKLEIKIQKQIASDLVAEMDVLKMKRVFDNILSNALKFTKKEGTIEVMLTSDTNFAYISISDNGIGIPEEMQKHLFEKFTRAKRHGVHGEKSHGLGMYIIRLIVELHEGQVNVKSKPNEGTCITVKLPVFR